MQINNFIPTSNDDPDRVDVYNLEKWTNYSKIQTNLNNFEELTIKQAERERKLAELSEKNIKNAYYRTPEIKTIIVDSIWQDPTEGKLNNTLHKLKIFYFYLFFFAFDIFILIYFFDCYFFFMQKCLKNISQKK